MLVLEAFVTLNRYQYKEHNFPVAVNFNDEKKFLSKTECEPLWGSLGTEKIRKKFFLEISADFFS